MDSRSSAAAERRRTWEALGGLASAAMAVNDSGQVVGDATNSSGADYAFPMAQETTHAPPSNKSERSSC